MVGFGRIYSDKISAALSSYVIHHFFPLSAHSRTYAQISAKSADLLRPASPAGRLGEMAQFKPFQPSPRAGLPDHPSHLTRHFRGYVKEQQLKASPSPRPLFPLRPASPAQLAIANPKFRCPAAGWCAHPAGPSTVLDLF